MPAAKKLKPAYQPVEWQRRFHASKARYRIACVGRRGGKSEAALHECVMFADQNPGSLVWWVSPSYDQAHIGWEKFFDAYPTNSPIYKKLVKSTKKTDPRIIHFTNGSRIEFRSADKPRGLRGRGVNKVVCDEAGEYPDEVWSSCLAPTLLDTGGEAVFISTPMGKNWYFDLYMRGFNPEEPDYESFHATSRDNTALPAAEVEAFLAEKQRNTPASEFRREYLAEFLEEDSEVFRGVKSCVQEHLPIICEGNRWFSEGFVQGAQYVIGVDVAIHTDFSVFTVVKIEPREHGIVKRVVYLERLQKLEFAYQANRLNSIWMDYGRPKVIVDAGGKGDSFVNELYHYIPRGLITPVVFDATNKRNYVLGLAAEIEQLRVELPDIPVLIKELQQYGWTKTSTGHFKYSAPGKKHDDCVISLALAVSGAKDVSRVRTLNNYQRAAILGM